MSSRLPGTAAAYLAAPDEVDVSPLFERLPGWKWVLPRIEEDRTVTFRDREVPMETHPFGIDQPTATGVVTPIPEIDVFLVPGLAFDSEGGRVGHGAGYYDRILSQRRTDSHAIAVTLDDRVLDSVPVFEHDQRVDWLATETSVTECSPPTS
jgi:5-formyltetrahydrofolate cyclo-ligase